MDSRNDTEFDEDVMFVDVPSDGDADPLALFASESDPNQEDRPTPRESRESKEASPAASLTRVRRPMALDQVLHRLGSVAWAEAVAIVEGLCEVLISGGRERVPEVSRIAITAAGGVVVGTGGVKDAAGPILARMLHTLAATGSLPAPLRLFVTKWTSAGDGHPIAEFAKELGYFARPDGQNLIQAVYERAVATVPVRPTPRPEVPRQVPPVRPPQARDSRFVYAAIAGVALLVISLTALVAWRGTGSPTRSSTPGSTATTAQPDGLAAGTDPPSVAGPGSQRGSGTRAAAATSGAADRRTTPVAPVSPRGNVADAPRGPVSSAVRATLASPAAASPRSAPTPPSSGAVASSGAVTSSRSALEATPVYSRWDPNVTPPVFLHPQLPSQLLSGLQPDMNTMELIVSETGSVERVRLLSTPKRMADMMLLSNAKNWEFEPASKDGQAVRYRLELSWAATP